MIKRAVTIAVLAALLAAGCDAFMEWQDPGYLAVHDPALPAVDRPVDTTPIAPVVPDPPGGPQIPAAGPVPQWLDAIAAQTGVSYIVQEGNQQITFRCDNREVLDSFIRSIPFQRKDRRANRSMAPSQFQIVLLTPGAPGGAKLAPLLTIVYNKAEHIIVKREGEAEIHYKALREFEKAFDMLLGRSSPQSH